MSIISCNFIFNPIYKIMLGFNKFKSTTELISFTIII